MQNLLGQKHGGNRARSLMAIIQVGKKKKEKRREEIEERHGKKKEIKKSKVLWRRIMSAVQIRVSTAGQYSTRYLASQCQSAEYYPQEIKE